MLTYLFDTSAAVELYCPRNRRSHLVLQHILQQRSQHRKATLLIPDFCIAEVFNVFARRHFQPTASDLPLTHNEYEECLTKFRSDVRWGNTLYPYELTRYHILAADEIILVEHKLAPREEKRHLSTLDILVIAMACELAYVGDPEKVFLVTWDRRMKTVFEELKKVDRTRLKELKVQRALGEPRDERWTPPTVLYVTEVTAEDIPTVEGQRPLSF